MQLLINKLSISTISVILAMNLASCGSNRADDLSISAPIIDEKPAIDNDRDKDGLLNDIEDGSCTDPDNPDTDGDGLLDGIEDANHNGRVDIGETNPCNKDTDGDGLSDGIEDANHNGRVDEGETDPLNPDTDGDGLLDGIEDANHNGRVDEGETNPLNPDTDGDGLFDGIEDGNHNGSFDEGETDPLNPDTDGDLVIDGVEDKNKNGIWDFDEDNTNRAFDYVNETDPREIDTDGDGLNDGLEDKNQNSIVDVNETDPLDTDTDNDGLSDGVEDKNLNGIWELDNNETNPINPDTDGDDLIDGVEDNNKNGILDVNETDPLNIDTDSDNLWDGNEVKRYNTNPVLADSDDDGLDDGREVYSCDEEIFDTTAISEHNASNKNITDSPDIIDALDPYNDSDEDGRTNIGEKEKGTNPCNPDDGYPWILDACQETKDEGLVYVPGGFDVDGDGEIESGFWFSQYPASKIEEEKLPDVRYEHFEDEMNARFNTLGFERANYKDGEVYHSNDIYKAKYTDEGTNPSDYMSELYAMDIPLALKNDSSCTQNDIEYVATIPTNKQYIHIHQLQEAYKDDTTTVANSILGNDINVPKDYKAEIYLLGDMREYTKDIVKIEGFEAPEYWQVSEIEVDDSNLGWTSLDILDLDGDPKFPGFLDANALVVRKGLLIDLTFGIGSGDATDGNQVVFRMATEYIK